jgi:hypothetical protein
MTLIEMEPYISGNSYLPEVNPPYRATTEDFQRWREILHISKLAPELIKVMENSTQFFKFEPDIAHYVPKKQREEMFYALKNGFFSPCVPAKCIYLIRKVYDTYKMCNLIPRLLPDTVFAKSYLAGGFTLQDTISTLCDKRYMPLARHRLSVPFEDYHEVYVKATDMVAAIPSKIASKLSDDEIMSIEVDTYGLRIKEVYIAFMGGYHGACNSIYDLRGLV